MVLFLIQFNPHITNIIERKHHVSNFETFMSKYNWGTINYRSKLDDWKRFQKNNPTIALNVLYTKKKKYFQLIFRNITQLMKNK